MGISPKIPLRTLSACLIGSAAILSLPSARAEQAPTRNLSTLRAAVDQQKALATAARNQTNGPHAAGEVFANPYRAYPPSCLNNGLPFNGFNNAQIATDVLQGQMTLLGDPAECIPGGNSAECNYQETDTVTVWRQDCSEGKSVTLLQIDRPSNASTTLYPTLPLITASQGTNSDIAVRVGSDPNTFFSTNFANEPLKTSDVFVLENYYSSTGPQFNYNKAFTLVTSNQDSRFSPLQFTFGDYAPPTNPGLMEISGYMSSNWASPTQNAEGIVLQVYDTPGNQTARVLAFAWFTYDKNGQPFWLFGQTSVPIGSTLISAPTYYFQGGKFAPPTTQPDATTKAWGFVTFKFPDCDHMNIAFNSTSNPPSPVPSGQGSATYTRVANVNGLTCQ